MNSELIALDQGNEIEDNLIEWLISNSEALQSIIQCLPLRKTPVPWYPAGPLEGEKRHQEMMNSTPQRIYQNLRMRKHVFLKLCTILKDEKLLKDSQYISVGQQIHLYIRVMGHQDSLWSLVEPFNHSLETVSRHVTQVMNALSTLHQRFVKLPRPDYIAPRIGKDPKYMPFFKDCIGALDGTHVMATTPTGTNPARWRNRKGYLSQNVLFVCSLDMTYLYVLPGFEGSAHDSFVLSHAQQRAQELFSIPPGKFYLADAGYTLTDSLLVPYRGVRYHLKELSVSGLKPTNKEELFNLRHASLRNVVERLIGVLKKRFPVLTCPSYYPYWKQTRNIYALTMLSNFIQLYDPTDKFLQQAEAEPHNNVHDGAHESAAEVIAPTQSQAHTAGVTLRDNLAKAMWHQYQTKLAERGHSGLSTST